MLRRWQAVIAAVCIATPGAARATIGSPPASADAGLAPEVSTGRHTDAALVQLPPAAEEGQRADLTLAIEASGVGAGRDGTLAVTLLMRREIAAVDEGAGTHTTRSTVSFLEIAQAPVGFDVATIDGLAGVTVHQNFDRTGAAAGTSWEQDAATDDQAAAAQQLVDWLSVTALGFPSDPIAVGSSWTSNGRAASTSIGPIDVVYQCRLASFSQDRYTVEISYAENFSQGQPGGGRIDGTISGQGLFAGSLDNPLVLGGSMNQSIDGIATDGGTATQLTETSVISLAAG